MSEPHAWERLRRELETLLELPEAERADALERISAREPELGRELGVLAGAARDDDFLARPALERVGRTPPRRAPERIGPWRLESEIGRGGMGTVWRGRRDDGAFAQTVAVKLVRAELSSELTRRRLAAERRILARLEHPAIARLLDGGTIAEGVPYLVLEYVEGERIDAWCDRQTLPLEARLRLFTTVCGAVDFAHRQLVLHRDLKTANILVDTRGGVKLLDFGIAKLLEPVEGEEELTSLGFARPLTPGWASPEQLRGAPLTTASDVYSLGVLLAVLTAGRTPHEGAGAAPEERARRIAGAGRVRLPQLAAGAAAPGVDAGRLGGDLERIAAKALAPDPAERYQTAAALADEIERFLAGRPVEAHPPSLAYRVGRFVRRRALPVSLAAAALAALAVSGLVSVLQARRAERESARAERRLAEVRELAGRFLFDLELGLRDLAGGTALREQVVSTALRYLELLAREAGDDPSLLDDLAQGYVKVGQIQGSPYLPNLGATAEAAASAARALELARRLAAIAPDSATARRRVAEAEQLRGDLAADAARYAEAGEAYAASIAAARAALARAPAETELRRLLGASLQRLASNAQAEGRFDEAIAGLGASLAEMRALAADDPARFTRNVAIGQTLLGQALLDAGRGEEALAEQRAALALAERLVAESPDSPTALRDWSAVADRTILALLDRGVAEEALALAERSLAVSEALAGGDPANVLGRFDLAASWHQVGRCARATGDLGRAATAFAASLATAERLVAEQADSLLFRMAVIDAHWGLAEVAEARGHRGEAIAQFEAARAALAAAARLAPEDDTLRARSNDAAARLAALRAPA